MEKHKKSYIISSFQVDFQAKLRLRTLFNLFQDVADEHAEKIGVGYTYCLQNHIGWVGGAYHVQIHRLPKWGDKVRLETWPSATTAAAAIRDFQLKDENETVLVSATSQWVLIDTERLRPLPIAKHLPHYELLDEHALPPQFEKIQSPEGTPQTVLFPVHADDIDLNRHVNNALYPTWVLDGLSEEFLKTHALSELHILFKRSAKLGDMILLQTYFQGNDTVSLLTNPDGSIEFARIRCIWLHQ